MARQKGARHENLDYALRLVSTQENYRIRGLERTRKFFFVLKSLVPTQSSEDKEKLSCPFQSTDNFPEWKLAFTRIHVRENFSSSLWYLLTIFICRNLAEKRSFIDEIWKILTLPSTPKGEKVTFVRSQPVFVSANADILLSCAYRKFVSVAYSQSVTAYR